MADLQDMLFLLIAVVFVVGAFDVAALIDAGFYLYTMIKEKFDKNG